MTKNSGLNKKTGGAVTAVILATVGFAQFPYLGKAGPFRDSSRPGSNAERVSDRAKVDQKISDKARANVLEASRRLNVTTEELHQFLNNQVKDRESMTTLLSEVLSSDKSARSTDELVKRMLLADILGSYVRLRSSGLPDKFHITEGDLVEIHSSWTPTQRNNFDRVLRRAADIAKTSKAITIEEAFELSLKENGLLESYRRGCQI